MRKHIALLLALVCVLGLVGCSQQGQQDIITPTQNNEEISQTDIQSEAEQKYTYEELSEMPADFRDHVRLYVMIFLLSCTNE